MRYDHFIRFVDKQSGDGCWNWIGRLNRHGYGEHRAWGKQDRGKYFAAHRLSWEFHVGRIPSGTGYHGTVVAHTCDNRKCVNPAHLFLTTQKGNLDDCLAKGRGNKATGARAAKTKLRDFEVADIRAQAASGADRAELAEYYNVCSQTIVDVVARKSWQHIPGEPGSVAKAPRIYDAKPNSSSFKPGSKGNPGPKPEMRTADYDKISALLDSGKSARQIAIECGTSHPTVARVAKLRGIKPQKKPKVYPRLVSWWVTATDRERIRDLKKLGVTGREIAAHLGVSKAAVWRALGASI